MPVVKITSIKKIERKTRYDLTVPATSNFYANGVLIHNTSAILGNLLLDIPAPTDAQKLEITTIQAEMDVLDLQLGKYEKEQRVGTTGFGRGWWVDFQIKRYTAKLNKTMLKQDEIFSEIQKIRQYGLVACSRTVVKTAGPQVNQEPGYYS